LSPAGHFGRKIGAQRGARGVKRAHRGATRAGIEPTTDTLGILDLGKNW